MKRWLLIGLGSTLILILGAIWVYLLFFSTSSPEARFADFELGDTTAPPTTPPPAAEPSTPTVDTSGLETGGLTQLTTDPVIGYQAITRGTSTPPLLYYVAGGTGHIYQIDPQTGQETRISNTTIPLSQAAAITPNGRYVMVRSGSGAGSEYTIGTLSTTSTSLATVVLGEPVDTFTVSQNNTFLYTVPSGRSLIGREYDPQSGDLRTLFTLPFREATVRWGATARDPHYAYPKTNAQLEGYPYRMERTTLERVPVAGFGLSAVIHNEAVLFARNEQNEYRTYLYQPTTAAVASAPLQVIPDKCVTDNTAVTPVPLICAGQLTPFADGQPDAWYQGTMSFSDQLWSIGTDRREARLLVDTEQATGRLVDVVNLQPAGETSVLFQNRLDGTLWHYDWRQLDNL